MSVLPLHFKVKLICLVTLLILLPENMECDKKSVLQKFNSSILFPEIQFANKYTDDNVANKWFLSDTIWEKIGKKYNIDPYLLYALAIKESKIKTNGMIQPYPYAIRVNGKNGRSYYPKSKKEAQQIIKKLINKTDNFDVGLAQINYHWHKDKVDSPLDLLDPETNLTIAAEILKKNFQTTNNFILAIGRFHSWNEKKAYRYGQHVKEIYSFLKKTIKQKEIHKNAT